ASHVGPLTDEHIIPLGLGGSVVIRLASCKACASITSRFEQMVQRTIMGPLRARLNLPTRRKKERPTDFKTVISDASDAVREISIRAGKYPRAFLGFLLPDAPFLRRIPASDKIEGQTWVGIATKADLEAYVTQEGSGIRLFRLHPHSFAQMLAKIA